MLISNLNTNIPSPPVSGQGGESPKVVVRDTSPPAQPQPSPVQVKGAVDEINRTLQQTHSNLEFSVDSSTHLAVMTLTDSETKQVIAQYPSKAALAIAESLTQSDRRQGVLLNKQA